MLCSIDMCYSRRMFSAILSHEHIGYCIDEITPDAISKVLAIFSNDCVIRVRICFVHHLYHSTPYHIIV